MALLDRLLRRNHRDRAHEANNLLRTTSCGFYYAKKRYSDVYLWLVVNKIFAGVRSVNIHDTSTIGNATVDALCKYVMSNTEALIWQYYDRGYMVLDVTKTAAPSIVTDCNTDAAGHVVEPAGHRYSVVYSPEYAVQRLSSFRILRNEFDAIDTYRSADQYLTESLGAVGIISGREMPMTAREKEDFLRELKSKVGITPDKFQFLVATGQIGYTPIAIPVSDLNLSGRVTDTVKLICDYLQVPFDIINFSGASTYANMEQAVQLFITNCISPLAEQLLLLIKHAIRLDTSLLVLSDNITFTIDNTTVSAREQSSILDTIKTELDILKQAQDTGLDTMQAQARITETINNIQL